MTTLGLVSDTHLPRFGRALPRALVEGMREAGVSGIVHCGDFTELVGVQLLRELGPLEAVAGNNDPPELARLFGTRRILTVEDARIGLVHGHVGRRDAHGNALAAFAGERLDAVFYGHSHRPRVERTLDGMLIANPGSPTDKRTNPRYSFAVVRVEGRRVEAELVFYDEKAP